MDIFGRKKIAALDRRIKDLEYWVETFKWYELKPVEDRLMLLEAYRKAREEAWRDER